MAKKKDEQTEVPEGAVEVVAPLPAATDVAGLLAAAAEGRKRATHVLPIPAWGISVKVAPAHGDEYERVMDDVRAVEVQGKKPHQDAWRQISWFCACVIEPKLTPKEALELFRADPAEVQKVAQLCEMLSTGTPWPLFMLHIWSQQAERLQEQEAEGTMPEGAHRFWVLITQMFAQFFSDANSHTVDWKAAGEVLLGEGIETPVQAAWSLEQHLEAKKLEAKNASEASSGSGELASSGDSEPPPSLDERAGTGETSTT